MTKSKREQQPRAPRSRITRAAGVAALAVAVAMALGALTPLEPAFISLALDHSFGATLHVAAVTRTGSRLISTYGPLGFVFYDLYLPATFGWLLLLQFTFAAVLCWVLAWIGYTAAGSPWRAAGAVAACSPFLALPDVRFLTLPLMAVVIELPRRGTAPTSLRMAIGAAVGMLSLIKFTFLIAALVVLGPLTVADAMRRRIPVIALAALTAGAIVWLAMGLTWGDWVAYLDWSLRDVTPGYGSAMQCPTTLWLTAHAAAVSAMLLGIGALLVWRRLRAGRAAAVLSLAGLLFLLFKAGFVRADVHVFITAFALLTLSLVFAVATCRTATHVAVALLVVAALPGALLWHAEAVHGAPTTTFQPVPPWDALRRLSLLPGVLWGDRLEREHARRTAQIRAEAQLPALHGPVDVYPYQQGLLIAHDVDFRPRPVFQSYMAYTPRLARANADVLLGERAPEWILFQPLTIDHRLPMLDEATSWPLFFTHYRVAGRTAGFALLQRRPVPLPSDLTPLGTVRTATGTPVDVPPASSGPIWARIDVPETAADRLMTALLAAPLVFMHITLHDGRTRIYSIVPSLAREGFLLSPLVENVDQFVRLLQREPAHPADDVASITMSVSAPLSRESAPHAVEVQFSRLVIGTRAAALGAQ